MTIIREPLIAFTQEIGATQRASLLSPSERFLYRQKQPKRG